MRIGIIGTGRIGGTLATQFARLGHEVAVSNSRGAESLADVVAHLGANARAATPAEAAAFGELVIVSVPFGRYTEVPVGDLGGKVVVDTNNYYPGRDGNYPELDARRTPSSELLAQHLGTARVVKAFNGINWEHLRDLGRPSGDPERIAIPISGDDPEEWVPQLALLQRVDAVVCNAGFSTTGEALAHGVPLVVAPIAYDSSIVAERVVAAGAAVRIRFYRCTAAELRAGVRQVLDDPTYRHAAAALQQATKLAGGASAAADALESTFLKRLEE